MYKHLFNPIVYIYMDWHEQEILNTIDNISKVKNTLDKSFEDISEIIALRFGQMDRNAVQLQVTVVKFIRHVKLVNPAPVGWIQSSF